MTVAELIAELEKIPVKDVKVKFSGEWLQEITKVERGGEYGEWAVVLS